MDKDAIESFFEIPGNQELEVKRRLEKEDETFAKLQKRGELWVLRVRYLRENVRSTAFEEATEMGMPVQKTTLTNLAQLIEVAKFMFHTRIRAGLSEDAQEVGRVYRAIGNEYGRC